MSESRKGRRRRKRDDDAAPEGDNVDLSGDEHAWWAGREELDSKNPPRGRRKRPPVQEPAKKSAFEEYYSTESLFAPPPAILDPDDPYAVLGVPASATWAQITVAHRTLAKRFHPDRLMDLPTEERAKSEARIRDLNIAYTELRRRRGK